MRMMVRHSSFSDRKISSTSAPVLESRAHVGSSARSTDGDHAIARAMATRCCCHPESWLGLFSYFSLRPTRARAFFASRSHSTRGILWYSSGSMTCSIAESRGIRLYPWNINPIFFPRNSASSSSVSFFVFTPSSRYSPLVGLSRSPMVFMSVDFPLPDGHMIATNSPSLIVRLIHLSILRVSPPIWYSRMMSLRTNIKNRKKSETLVSTTTPTSASKSTSASKISSSSSTSESTKSKCRCSSSSTSRSSRSLRSLYF